MALTKEAIEQELQNRDAGTGGEIHLWREGTFLRAYDWSAWLCCHFLHDFKVNKRQFKDIDEPVAYIGFPESSIGKWLPEGAEQTVLDEKHLLLKLPAVMLTERPDDMQAAYAAWRETVPLSEPAAGQRKRDRQRDDATTAGAAPVTLTAVMQRILAWPIESKSPMESMAFLAEIKQQIAQII
ncbi:MAG: hypothetical protein IJ144_02375 [Prevotella sp.]|nr:hypothetical protein [Prevotella sp.]MBQ9186655.1 hypothetical protein [Prevotella sp.]